MLTIRIFCNTKGILVFVVPSNEIFYLEKAKVADYFFVTFTENSLVVYLEVCSVWTFWTFGIEVKTIMKEKK